MRTVLRIFFIFPFFLAACADEADYRYREKPETPVVVEDEVLVEKEDKPVHEGAIDLKNGEYLRPAGKARVYSDRRGEYYPSSGQGYYVNQKTGERYPEK